MSEPGRPPSLKIWKFESAPEWARRLHQGEDAPKWVLQAPEELAEEVIDVILEDGSAAAEAGIRRYTPGGGVVVYIGAGTLPHSVQVCLVARPELEKGDEL
jgi:hypothetical protein